MEKILFDNKFFAILSWFSRDYAMHYLVGEGEYGCEGGLKRFFGSLSRCLH